MDPDQVIAAQRKYQDFLKAELKRAERQAWEDRRSAAEAGQSAASAHARAQDAAEHAAAQVADAECRAAAAVDEARRRQELAEHRLADAISERDVILGSTAWKLSAPLRLVMDRTPAIRRAARSIGLLRHRQTAPAVPPPVVPDLPPPPEAAPAPMPPPPTRQPRPGPAGRRRRTRRV